MQLHVFCTAVGSTADTTPITKEGEEEEEKRLSSLSKKSDMVRAVATECSKSPLHQHHHSASHPFLWHWRSHRALLSLITGNIIMDGPYLGNSSTKLATAATDQLLSTRLCLLDLNGMGKTSL